MKSGIIYKGPSLLDGKPIVVIATYSKRNIKTGVVVQTYILVDGINPLEASKTGADFSICGTCAMRGEVTTDPNRKQAKNRRCYVNLGQGVLIVFTSHLSAVFTPWQTISPPVSPLDAVVLCASAPMVMVQRFPTTFGKNYFRNATLLPRTVINRDGVQISRCKARIITRKRSCTGKQDGARFA
jgi:hypothetical protein